jgi:prevent-host-death family protein
MRAVQVVEAKAKFSSLLAAVEAGEEIAITRHGRVVARLVPDTPRMAEDLFRPFWDEPDFNIEAPADLGAEPVAPLD